MPSNQKWVNFHSSHSPINKVEVNTNPTDIVEDWKRLDWKNTFINGQRLDTLMLKHKLSKETVDEDSYLKELNIMELTVFLNAEVLKDVSKASQPNALEYLMKSFHQGGLLHPVSKAMFHLFSKDGLGPAAVGSPKQVNIVTDKDGFSVQEIYTVKTFKLTPIASDDLQSTYPDLVIRPDQGKDYCLKAQSTLKVSFSGAPEPAITVENTSISYGNADIQSLADTRQWYVKVLDFIKNIFKGNAVVDLSTVEKKPEPEVEAPAADDAPSMRL